MTPLAEGNMKSTVNRSLLVTSLLITAALCIRPQAVGAENITAAIESAVWATYLPRYRKKPAR